MERKKLSKKTAFIGAISIMLVWFAIWGFALWYFSGQVNDASTRGFVEQAQTYMAENSEFTDRYGKLTAIQTDSEKPVKNEVGETVQYYMDFTITTASGDVKVRVSQTWENETWVLGYVELPAE